MQMTLLGNLKTFFQDFFSKSFKLHSYTYIYIESLKYIFRLVPDLYEKAIPKQS